MASLFIVVQVIAIVISPIYSQTQTEAMGGRETIENPSFAFVYLGIILLFTFVILWIAKRKKEKFIKYLILGAIFMTIMYLFIPLTIAIMYPSSDNVWGYNEIGSDVLVLAADDVDGDGIIEIVAGCADNKIRVYESENHTLEWESFEFNSNITQILIDNLDNDTFPEMVVATDVITVFDEDNFTENWTLSASQFNTIAVRDLNGNGTSEIIIGTKDARILIFESQEQLSEINVTSYLNEITYIGATDEGGIIAANHTKIIVLAPTTYEIQLEITELEEITALTVYNDPEGEDYIIASDEKRPYLFNLSSAEHERRGPKIENIRAIYLEHYSIPKFNDSIPDVIVLTEDTVYISPDLIKHEKGYYFLTFSYDIHSFLNTDLDEDGVKDIVLGKDDGYKYDSIVFGEGADYTLPIIISIAIALSLTILVLKFPEWYVVDAVGLVMAIGATVILGITFAILPAIVLLGILAVYDAISVYKTKHMISLADSVIDLNLPVLLVIPKKRGYSFRKKKPRLKEQLESGEEREAMFMGLGDIVIPSLLIVSSLSFLPGAQSGIGIAGNLLVCIGTMIGILVGFSILMSFVLKGNPQAGLPLLNSGAIGGYLISYILVFSDFGFGFNLNFM